MKSFAKVAVAGVASIALFKVFTAALIPALGMTLSLIMLMVKVALVAGVAYFLYTILKPRSDEDDAVVDGEFEEEIEIIVEDGETPGSE
jgi:hypothetical protein